MAGFRLVAGAEQASNNVRSPVKRAARWLEKAGIQSCRSQLTLTINERALGVTPF